MKNYGPCVVMRPRKGGLVKFRFEVRRNRPEGWPATRTILVNGRDGVKLADMTPQMEAEVDRQAEALFRQLGQLRALEAADLRPQPLDHGQDSEGIGGKALQVARHRCADAVAEG